MSLLDRLKREGDQQRAQQEVVTRERDVRDALYKNENEPRMKAQVTYLEALVATLNEVRPPVVVKMPIAGYGDLGAQPVWDFRIDHDRRYRNFVITMDWTLRVDPEHTPVVRAEGVTKIKTLTAAFHKFHLGGVKEEKRNKSGELLIASFHARGHIKARLEAKVSADDPVLRMVLSNVSWLGSSQRQFIWQQIDDDLSDRIARFIVREDDSLFTEELGDSLRQQLKKESDAQTVVPEIAPVAQVEVAASPVVVPGTAQAQAPVDVAGSAVADILAQLDPNAVPKEELTRLTEPDAPDLPSLDELNAAFHATPVRRLEVLPLGVPGAPTEPVAEATSDATFVERRAPLIAGHAAERALAEAPQLAVPAPVATMPAASVSLPLAAPLSQLVALAPAAPQRPENGTGSIAAPAPTESAKTAAPSLFMSRMSETLKRLRDDEAEGQ